MLKVAKFGGSSLADDKQYQKVKEIVLSDPSRRFVVVSAAGKREKSDNKITDLLYLTHAHLKYGASYESVFSMVEQRYTEIKKACGLSIDLESEFKKLRSELNKNMSVDYLVSRGEYISALLLAEYLGFEFLDSKDWLYFNYDGQIDMERSTKELRSRITNASRMVIPGFYGSLPNGHIKVMTRGGSDISGAVVAAIVGADIYENWTDVSGILMADPRIVENPRRIERITYAELRELSYMGAEVLHDEAIFPVRENNIPLNIRNTNAPEDPGTLIMETIDEDEDCSNCEHFITGIAGKKNFSIISLYKGNMSNESGTIRKALGVFENYKIVVDHITSGIDSFSVVVLSDKIKDCLYEIINEIKQSCNPDSVKVTDNIALVATVGRKMVYRPGMSGRLFATLGNNDINIRLISQGPDEINIIVGVENKDFEKTINLLYSSFAIKEG